jgi:hypothetical protein
MLCQIQNHSFVTTGDGVVGFGVGGAWVVGGPTVVTTSIS